MPLQFRRLAGRARLAHDGRSRRNRERRGVGEPGATVRAIGLQYPLTPARRSDRRAAGRAVAGGEAASRPPPQGIRKNTASRRLELRVAKRLLAPVFERLGHRHAPITIIAVALLLSATSLSAG